MIFANKDSTVGAPFPPFSKRRYALQTQSFSREKNPAAGVGVVVVIGIINEVLFPDIPVFIKTCKI